MGHLRDIRTATEELQEIESEILKVFKEGRPEDYPPLKEKLLKARERYDKACALSFRSDPDVDHN